ncbi:probable basic-leucine zipper transcription factor H isoform X2 [Condylostylus longicornis]|uniref:probable basic-leucine zipper transcription factor H isoform X2 n=1 Tax=Condylostylus longicornis TaxID=2530218 RepID=UPI00244DE2AC|nr:probable basic-leucine zipper transcription factor H isoform X2 [Condylostylus longicornis]
MAARPSRPPELKLSNNEEEEEEENSSTIINSSYNNTPNTSLLKDQPKQQSRCPKIASKNDCSCTNISIMHLFHEMKQKFPTVPDNIVNQCVISNCHDRENCIRSLQNELNLYSTTSQSYPSNALRIQQSPNNIQSVPIQFVQQENVNAVNETNFSNDNVDKQPHLNVNSNNSNKVLKPIRPAPAPQINLKNINCDLTKNSFNSKQQSVQKSSNTCADTVTSIIDNRTNILPPSQPQRPTTLKFREPITNDYRFQQNKAQESATNKTNNVQLKPVRKAPAPPVSIMSPSGDNLTPLSSSSSQNTTTPTTTSISQKNLINQQNFPNFDHSYSSSIQSPFSDSTESEISVNISLSPTSERSRMSTIAATTTIGQNAQPQIPRRITSITLQPEPPYTRDFMIQNNNPSSTPSQRSYTSLNLTLRKPTNTPQSPIDITAGPGLSYSSSSFDAGLGVQKNFHISVNAEGGVFRASSIRPKSFPMKPIPHSEEEFRNNQPPNMLRPATSEQNFYKNIMQSTCDKFNKNVVIDSPLRDKQKNNVKLQLVERQKVRKEQLIKAIEKNRKKLQQVQEEIHILKSPETPGESERLDYDIEILRSNCEHLFNEIENSKRLVGQQNLSIANEYNNSSSQIRQRPPRPPPPRLTHITSLQSANNETMMNSPSSMSLTSSSFLSSNINAGRNLSTSAPTNLGYNTATTNIQNLTDEDGPQWSCKHCTFLNNPLMIRCENCDYDREIPGGTLNVSTIPPLTTTMTATTTSTTISTNSAAFVDNTSFENNNLPSTAYNCL